MPDFYLAIALCLWVIIMKYLDGWVFHSVREARRMLQRPPHA
jgi:hypothetical protein